MIDAQSDTLAGIRNKALLSLGYDFLARRSELVALRTTDLEFTKDGALKGMIRKSKPTSMDVVGLFLALNGALNC